MAQDAHPAEQVKAWMEGADAKPFDKVVIEEVEYDSATKEESNWESKLDGAVGVVNGWIGTVLFYDIGGKSTEAEFPSDGLSSEEDLRALIISASKAARRRGSTP